MSADLEANDSAGQERTAATQDRSARRRSSGSSIVQSKLHAAIQVAEKTLADSTPIQPQTSFRARGAAREAIHTSDRSVSRYRNDAAIVSFSDQASSFCYSTNFLPGVHFYTFLASREVKARPPSPPPPLRRDVQSISENEPQEDNEEPVIATKKTITGGLRMTIPDTIVYGETGRAVWLYTDKDGYIQRTAEVTDKAVLEKFTHNGAENEPVVVCKEAIVSTSRKAKPSENALSYQGNILRLLTLSELKTLLSNVSATRSNKTFVLQRFIKCNGSKAFIVRAVYDCGKPNYAWMINNTVPMQEPTPTVSQVLMSLGQDVAPPPLLSTANRTASFVNRSVGSFATTEVPESASTSASAPALSIPLINRLCTTVQSDKSCTFIKLNERGCATVSELNQRVVKYLEQRLYLRLQTLVCDYTKDSSGTWWLLQVKAFRVRNKAHPDRVFSLPMKLRLQYLSHRDTSVLEDNSESEGESERQATRAAIQLAQRQVRKLMQCKCCLAAYPKDELSFKMTLKMINEMLVRIRSRLPPEKNYTFLSAAMAREGADPSLAYESWSVCSFCYAIYERDQQLQRVEVKFARALGTPDPALLPIGLGRVHDQCSFIDPNSNTTVLPPVLTLCRLMLVINGIYDIPPELYDAEKDRNGYPSESQRVYASGESRLYLRIAALGFTECIPINSSDILLTHERAPRGVIRRRSSALSADEDDADDPVSDRRASTKPEDLEKKNYFLPLNLIRTVHFFAPRTPLHAKLKETSGLVPFLNEDNSILLQLIRATEPPLDDPTTVGVTHRSRTRRKAIAPEAPSMAEMMSQMRSPQHSILLGATKIRMAQFRSAYVTKLDFYACMALSGELFNIKGNIGLERVRYVDTKLLTTQHRLRSYNGVLLPDASYMPTDPLSSEWMDTLNATMNPYTSSINTSSPRRKPKRERAPQFPSKTSSQANSLKKSTSVVSIGDDREEMDEELEDIIERAVNPSDTTKATNEATPSSNKRMSMSSCPQPPESSESALPATRAASQAELALIKQDLMPKRKCDSSIDSQMSMLMAKPVLSPRSPLLSSTTRKIASITEEEADMTMWSLVVRVNHAHNLQSRERPFCRWECQYSLFGLKRSAVQKHSTSQVPPASPNAYMSSGIQFASTHRFFLAGTTVMLQSYMRTNHSVVLHLRNDVYASTRTRPGGEFFSVLSLQSLLKERSFDTTLDIQPASDIPELTPREAASVAKAPPYLSVSVELSQLQMHPHRAISSGDFVVVGSTVENVLVLKKIV